MGCDSLVALAPATAAGATLFAKNSDRPARGGQRVIQLPRLRHPPGTRLRCQYLEVPQVGETAAVLGSQPYWLWGFEHGVNEHRVAIGNQTVFTRESLGPVGLLGMDLVRLGLERGQTAEEALGVITRLVEEHGQGGSGHIGMEWPYHNAFLLADPGAAWELETSGRHWVARQVRDVGNVTNGLHIGADWERASADASAFAVAQGWWKVEAGRLDFAAAYADASGVPPNLCAARRHRAAALLAHERGRLTAARLRAILRDHYDAGPVHRPRAFEDREFFSLCMHADPLDNTTASMVAALRRDRNVITPTWVSLGSPCVGAFLPCYLEGNVPPLLARAGAASDPRSPWWQMRALLDLVARDFAERGPHVRETWDRWENEIAEEAEQVERAAAADYLNAGETKARARLTSFMERTLGRYLALAEALASELTH